VRLDLNCPVPLEEKRVEGVVLEHLHRDDAPVFYVENTLANTLFGLLCWPRPVRRHPRRLLPSLPPRPGRPVQPRLPPAPRARVRGLPGPPRRRQPRDAILATWEEKAGIQSPFVAWDYLDREIIELALRCIPAAHLKLWFRASCRT
jgi:hypothetical protein